MRNPRCAFNAAAALHRVFIAPTEHTQLLLSQRVTSALFIQSRLGPSLSQRRNAYVDVKTKAEKSRLPRNNEITAYSVVLVNEDGRLSVPRQTKSILEELDLDKFVLQTMVAGGPGVPPICKIQNKEALRNVEKLRRKNERKSAMGSKTLELNWAIEKGDLNHRLNKLKGFLMKGLKVEVLMASKRKGRRALEPEAMEVVQKIEAAIKDVGAKEYKPRDGQLLQQLIFYIQGKSTKATKLEEHKTQAHEVPITEDAESEQLQKKRRKRWEPLPEEKEKEDEAAAQAIKKTDRMKVQYAQNPKETLLENPALAALRRAVASSK